MTDKDIKAFVPKLKVYHLRIEEDEDAGTIIGYDRDEVFFRAIRKDPDTWIVSTIKTKTVNWKDHDKSRSTHPGSSLPDAGGENLIG